MIFKKLNKEKKISMVTCYDYSFAQVLNRSSIDIILVGDSLANVVFGFPDTRGVSLDQMVSHTAAVCRGAPDKVVVADMPYQSCQKKNSRPLEAGQRLINAGAAAVKVEWFRGCKKVISELIENQIVVMGHIGLTPQTAHLLGGYRVQGRDSKSANVLIQQAKKLESLGVSSIVLECLREKTAKKITESVDLPTIGIGAGRYCSGQVLVLYDLLGLYSKKMKFARVFSDVSSRILEAINSYDQQVKEGEFPSSSESFL